MCEVLEESPFLLLRYEITGEWATGKYQPPMGHGDNDEVFEVIISHTTRERENM